MRLRQEQVVFLASVVVLALMAWSLTGDARTVRGGRSRGGPLLVESFAVPDVVRVLPASAELPAPSRELFVRPRDTRPLPLLTLADPPLERLPALLPPADPGPSPRRFGDWLRTPADEVDVPDLFGAAVEEAGFFGPEDDLEGGASVLDDLRRASGSASTGGGEFETPAEREARQAAYRRQYDWIQRSPRDVIFGRIVNAERFGLKTDVGRANEPIEFIQVDPDTGRQTYASVGAPAIPYAHDRFEEFGFAATPSNQLELRRRAIELPLTRVGHETALHLAADAVRARLEAPRALEIAEELYQLCVAFDREDPESRLGLAACYEAGFDFDRAAREYEAVIATFPHRVEAKVGLAQLEQRFLLNEAAEERLRAALQQDGSSWMARFGLGRFLLGQGRTREAVEHLSLASRLAPQEPERLHVRVAIRTDYAAALLAEGDVAEAALVFQQALTADPTHQRALGGAVITDLLAGGTGAAGPARTGAGIEGAGYELSLALGIVAMTEGRFAAARDHLRAAEYADPLRAVRPLAALSFLAERTGHPEQALGFVEEALTHQPRDAWSLYQRGRLLAGRDDFEGALESLTAALEVEADFEDALVALGRVSFHLGLFEDAERYLARALVVGGERPEVLSLRGINFLRLGVASEARASFARALVLAPGYEAARGGVAWCTYLDGDSREAKVQLADLDEARRTEAEDDVWRVWAREQIDRIRAHEDKVEWVDAFDRKRLMNGWVAREGVGPIVSMVDGAVDIEGVFDARGVTQVFREYSASQFVSVEADVWIDSSSNVRAGLFIARERQRRGAADVIGEVSVSRHKEGGVQVRFIEQGNSPEITDMEQLFPTREWVRLRIERSGTTFDSSVTIAMNGIPLVEDVPIASLGRAASPLLLGFFVEGEAGRHVSARMDNVAVVYRK